jgi:hypothetical protein
MKDMCKLMVITIAVFGFAGCLDEVQDEHTARRSSEGEEILVESRPVPRTDTDDLIPPVPTQEVTHCVVNDDCMLQDPDTEYRKCDVESGTCIRNDDAKHDGCGEPGGRRLWNGRGR